MASGAAEGEALPSWDGEHEGERRGPRDEEPDPRGLGAASPDLRDEALSGVRGA